LRLSKTVSGCAVPCPPNPRRDGTVSIESGKLGLTEAGEHDGEFRRGGRIFESAGRIWGVSENRLRLKPARLRRLR